MRVVFVVFAFLSVILNVPALATEEDADAKPPEAKKETVIIEVKCKGECPREEDCAAKDCDIIIKKLDDVYGETIVMMQDGEKVLELSPECCELDIGKLELDLREFKITELSDIPDVNVKVTMMVNQDGEEITINARGDKEALRAEIESIVEDLEEDGGKIEVKELDDGYDIIVKPEAK